VKRAIAAIAVVFAAGWACQGRTITVDDDGPADFSTIQAAIDDSNDGDTVLVADGSYTGVGNRDIDFHGKAITVRSENGPETCIIDCNGTEADPHRGFYFQSGEDANSAIIGFTITNGRAPIECDPRPPWPCNYLGGGIRCDESSPMISDCTITGSWAYFGAGIGCEGGSPIITECTITGNHAVNGGGGMSMWESNPIISNCTFSDNSVDAKGGAVYSSESNPVVTSCTFAGNLAELSDGGSIYSRGTGNPTLRHCVLWGNAPQEIYVYEESSSVTASYCDIEGGWAGEGNIDADPCFADPDNGDYHLKSQGGRYDPNEGGWTTDEVTSPCIDAGDPMSPIQYEPFPNGGVINIGAYGGTAEASKSWFGGPVCETIVAGDIDGNCLVDFRDFRLMAMHWLESH